MEERKKYNYFHNTDSSRDVLKSNLVRRGCGFIRSDFIHSLLQRHYEQQKINSHPLSDVNRPFGLTSSLHLLSPGKESIQRILVSRPATVRNISARFFAKLFSTNLATNSGGIYLWQ
jgi:hypothetical protein